MKWLTISQIKRRSKTAKGALKVSHEHWCQLYDATAKELRAEYKRTDEIIIKSNYCGLCTFHGRGSYKACGSCVFNDFCEFDLWNRANNELNCWYDKESYGDWWNWKRACKAVRDKLKELMEV
jgi:hypothetical protein